LDVVLSLSLALVFGTLFLPTSLQHLLCSLSENGERGSIMTATNHDGHKHVHAV